MSLLMPSTRIAADAAHAGAAVRPIPSRVMSRVMSRVIAALLSLVVAACGDATPGKTTAGDAPARSRDQDAATVPRDSAPAASSSPDAGQRVDPCTLLTDAEIQQHTGFGVRGKESHEGNGRFFPPSCIWTLDTDTKFAGLHTITIDVTRPGGRTRFDALSSLTPVAGLGDGAVKTGGNTAGTMWTVSGDALVKLAYSLPVTVVDPDPMVVPLARIVLSKL